MNNDTERLARQVAKAVKNAPNGMFTLKVIDAADHILSTTTPPTMADVEWDDDEHHLAGATTHTGFDVVMMRYDVDIDLIVTDEGNLPCSWLTPNGKRYELREIKEPEHPEMLTTKQDYENAPEGTIVALNKYSPYVKHKLGVWSSRDSVNVPEERMAVSSRKVLRWGWGE